MLTCKALNKYSGDDPVILVLWHCMRKENEARIEGVLNKGEFYFTRRDCEEKLNLSRHQVDKCMKTLKNDGIINPVKISRSKKEPSIYLMVNIAEKFAQKDRPVNRPVNRPVDDVVGASNFSTSEIVL